MGNNFELSFLRNLNVVNSWKFSANPNYFLSKKKDQSFLETIDMDIIVYFADLSFDL